MKTKHSFIPPQQLVDKWVAMFEHCDDIDVLTEVAQWGADQELDACCEWIYKLMDRGLEWSMDLRAARRPKPPSLKEQALTQLDSLHADLKTHGLGTNTDTIRRALEQLND